MKQFATIALWAFFFLIVTNAKGAIIIGFYPSLKDGDKVTIHASKYGYPNFTDDARDYTTVVKNHKFKLIIPTLQYPLLCFVGFESKDGITVNFNFYHLKAIREFYIENGDAINVTETKSGLFFSGKGSFRNQIIHEINKRTNGQRLSRYSLLLNPVKYYSWRDSLSREQLKYLNSNKHNLSTSDYFIIKAYIIGEWYNILGQLTTMYEVDYRPLVDSLKDVSFNLPINKRETVQLNNSQQIIYSDSYSDGLLTKYMYDSCYVEHREFDIHKYYTFIKQNYPKPLASRLVANILFTHRTTPEDKTDLVDDALTWIKNKDFFNILWNLKNHRIEGAQAFDFTLQDTLGNIHKMGDYKGKIVFLDFWFTGCGNCIRVTPYMEKIESQFKNDPVVFLSINIDKDRKMWINGIKTGKYTTAFGINLNVGPLGLNSPISRYYNVDGGPTLILIDKKGKLMPAFLDPREDNGATIIRFIQNGIR